METTPDAATDLLLARWHAFFFPEGKDAARSVRSVCTVQNGEMRQGPDAPWIPFRAEETVDATTSSFRWTAHVRDGLKSFSVTDAYEQRRGRLDITIAGVIPARQITGPDIDKGELQRYLASVAFCPPMLLNHASLQCMGIDEDVLRLRDEQDPTGATVDLELDEKNAIVKCRADRPRQIGKVAVLTPWSAQASQFQTFDGLHVFSKLEVSWHLLQGKFTYFRSEIVSMHAQR